MDTVSVLCIVKLQADDTVLTINKVTTTTVQKATLSELFHRFSPK